MHLTDGVPRFWLWEVHDGVQVTDWTRILDFGAFFSGAEGNDYYTHLLLWLCAACLVFVALPYSAVTADEHGYLEVSA